MPPRHRPDALATAIARLQQQIATLATTVEAMSHRKQPPPNFHHHRPRRPHHRAPRPHERAPTPRNRDPEPDSDLSDIDSDVGDMPVFDLFAAGRQRTVPVPDWGCTDVDDEEDDAAPPLSCAEEDDVAPSPEEETGDDEDATATASRRPPSLIRDRLLQPPGYARKTTAHLHGRVKPTLKKSQQLRFWKRKAA